jgi:hypothetical protein
MQIGFEDEHRERERQHTVLLFFFDSEHTVLLSRGMDLVCWFS